MHESVSFLVVTIITCNASLLCLHHSALAVTLIDNGKAKCTIVVPSIKNDLIQAAAEDLRDHLRIMSGAEVPVVTLGSQVTGLPVYVGVMPKDAHLPPALLQTERFFPDDYAIVATDKLVLLWAPRPEGVSNAVYGLLEDYLGCHWFTPGSIGVYVPRRATVKLDIANGYTVVRPSFELRSPWYNGNASARQTPDETAQIAKWRTHNRGGGLRGYSAQEWYAIFPKELQEKEPGLQAMVNGKREPHGAEAQICMSYHRAVEIATNFFISVFKNNPQLDYYTFSANDNNVWCQCPQCAAMGDNQAERLMVFTNKVANAVAAACPGKGIAMIAHYTGTNEPPPHPMKGAPNLYPINCSFSMEQLKPFTDNNSWCNEYRRHIEQWMKILPRAWSYDYVGWYPGPWTLFHKLQQDQDYYRKLGFTGMMSEYIDRNVGTDVCLWLSYQMAWDKNRQVDDLLKVFYADYFGAAADDMHVLYEAFEKRMQTMGGTGEMMDVPTLYPMPLVEDALARIAGAKMKVKEDATLVARIERDENCLKLTKLWLEFWSASGSFRRSGSPTDKSRAAQAAEAYLKLIDSLDGTLTVGKAARGYVVNTLSTLNDPGTFFAKAGPFQYVDDLNDGGKVYQAKSRSGFSIGVYGLYLAPNATGEVVYDLRAGVGLKFKEARLMQMYLTLPQGGHNKIEISLDQGKTWTTAYQDIQMSGGTTEYDLTKHVAGANQFLLKFWIKNSDKEILGMDNWGITGVIE